MTLSDDDKAALRAIIGRISATDGTEEEQTAALAVALAEAGLDPTPEEWAAFSREELGVGGAAAAQSPRAIDALDAIMGACRAHGVATLGELMARLGVQTPGRLLTALGFTGDTDALGIEVEAALRVITGGEAEEGEREEEQALHCRLVAEDGVPVLDLAWLSHEAVAEANYELSAADGSWTRIAGVDAAYLPDFMAATLTPLMADMIARVADPSRAMPPTREEFVAFYAPYFEGLFEGAYTTGLQIRADQLPGADGEDDDVDDE
jgi:hypothetical protein